MPDDSLKTQQKRELKTARIPIKIVPAEALRKPEWIRARAGGGERFFEIKKILREAKLHTVCEEASCPNVSECWGGGTATVMLMGAIVDAVEEVVNLSAAELEPTPDFGGSPSTDYILGMATIHGGVKTLLDLDKVFLKEGLLTLVPSQTPNPQNQTV